MSSDSLIFFIRVPNLLLIQSSIFSITDIHFDLYKFKVNLYLYLPFLSLTYSCFPPHVWNIFIAVVLMTLPLNSIICSISGFVTTDYIFPTMSYTFLLLCIPGNFLLDSRHCKCFRLLSDGVPCV